MVWCWVLGITVQTDFFALRADAVANKNHVGIVASEPAAAIKRSK